MTTYDASGNVIADDFAQWEADAGVSVGAGTPGSPMVLPTMTVTAPATSVSFSLADLLKPPYLYYAVGALALVAYFLSRQKR